MEWLDGQTLAKRLGTVLSRSEAESICTGIIDGIDHLHSHDVTHSDFHEGNVVITSDGPRIIDIDYSSSRSLSLLTTLGRDDRIKSDIAQLALVMHGVLLKTSSVDLAFLGANQFALRKAVSLAEIRSFVTTALAQTGQAQLAIAPRPVSGPSLLQQTETAIERGRKPTLRRLVMGTANAIAEEMASAAYAVQGIEVTNEVVRERVAQYNAAIGPILPPLGAIGFWPGRHQRSLAVEAIDRLANANEKSPMDAGNVALLGLRKYPVMQALYATGVGAVAADNYQSLFSILRDTSFYQYGMTRVRLLLELAHWAANSREVWNRSILGRDHYFPVSQVMEDQLRGHLKPMIPSDIRYREKFERFELFASLDYFLQSGHAIGGNFVWRRRGNREEIDLLAEVTDEAAAAGPTWRPIRAGLLANHKDKDINSVLQAFRQAVQELRGAFHMPR